MHNNLMFHTTQKLHFPSVSLSSLPPWYRCFITTAGARTATKFSATKVFRARSCSSHTRVGQLQPPPVSSILNYLGGVEVGVRLQSLAPRAKRAGRATPKSWNVGVAPWWLSAGSKASHTIRISNWFSPRTSPTLTSNWATASREPWSGEIGKRGKCR